MKIITFSGSSPTDAMQKAKMHPEYDKMLHIDTKEVRKKSFTKDAIYEIIMGIEESSSDFNGYDNIKRVQKPIIKASEDIHLDISNAAKQMSKIAQAREPMFDYADIKKPQIQSEPPEIKEIKQELLKLGDNIKLIQNILWQDKAPSLQNQIPPEFAEIYRLALDSGMDFKHLELIMSMTLEHMPLNMRENSLTIKRYFQTLLRKMLNIRSEDVALAGEKKVIMLVGPTGVGKTTTVAKLAARFSFLMQKKYKVGLVVLDTFRIGALEHLMQYARMMKLSIETVVNPPEFTTALESLKHCDYILIDTMGSSPYDKKKLQKIYECLRAGDNYNIDVTLVLPSSIKYEDLKITYENFSPLGIDSLLFTKLDETKAFGNIFSLAYEVQKPLSYFSLGQEVPEDLVVASSEFLIECLLSGFDRSRV